MLTDCFRRFYTQPAFSNMSHYASAVFPAITFLILCLLAEISLSACQQPGNVRPSVVAAPDTLALPLPLLTTPAPATRSYADCKQQVQQQRQGLKKALAAGQITTDSVRQAFNALLLQHLIPYWYGTPWSFDGHTEVPNQGETACGYFVSTTLRDAGLPVNRYKLAQKSPADEAQALAYGSEVLYLSGQTDNWLDSTLHHHILKDGLYFIGLGNGHVGYLLRQQQRFYALHSNYYPPNTVVVRQPIEDSVYRLFGEVRIVNLSWNDALLREWLK